jgi:hypothetical protein
VKLGVKNGVKTGVKFHTKQEKLKNVSIKQKFLYLQYDLTN